MSRRSGNLQRTLPNVVHVEENLFTCSQDTQDKIKAVIRETRAQPGLVVASCSPRTPRTPVPGNHPGGRPSTSTCLKMANIRDPEHLGSTLNQPDLATQKAKDLVSMAVGQGQLDRTPVPAPPGCDPPPCWWWGRRPQAGMEAALSAAGQGFEVFPGWNGDSQTGRGGPPMC